MPLHHQPFAASPQPLSLSIRLSLRGRSPHHHLRNERNTTPNGASPTAFTNSVSR
ncbi:MAG: hypothetical protein F6K30_26240 [Cyanothece sp. SIO2G6]|nr:hypothetical protein [Cyanothece sp. SIO2G6]